jgi:hypothetical protein
LVRNGTKRKERNEKKEETEGKWGRKGTKEGNKGMIEERERRRGEMKKHI